MIFKFQFRGTGYNFDDEKMSLGEARWIKAETGLVGMGFFDAVKGLDPDAISAMVVLAMRRAGVADATMESIADDENGLFEFFETGEVVETPPKNGPAPRRKTAAKS